MRGAERRWEYERQIFLRAFERSRACALYQCVCACVCACGAVSLTEIPHSIKDLLVMPEHVK